MKMIDYLKTQDCHKSDLYNLLIGILMSSRPTCGAEFYNLFIPKLTSIVSTKNIDLDIYETNAINHHCSTLFLTFCEAFNIKHSFNKITKDTISNLIGFFGSNPEEWESHVYFTIDNEG